MALSPLFVFMLVLSCLWFVELLLRMMSSVIAGCDDVAAVVVLDTIKTKY